MSMQSVNWNSGARVARRQESNETTRAVTAAQVARRLRAQYIEERLRMARNAADAHALYLELVARAKTADCKALYQRLAETEQRHLLRHTMRLRKLGHKAPKFQRSWLTKTWHCLLATFAPTSAHKRLEQMRRGETRRQIELIRRQSDLRQTQRAAGD